MTKATLEDVYSTLTKMSDSEFANAASGEFCEDLKAMIEGAIGRALEPQAALAAIDPVALVQAGIDAAAAECAKQREDFLSPQYAVGQPISSMMERFACDECGNAIRALSASDVLKEMK